MGAMEKIIIRYKLGALSFYKMDNGLEVLCNSISYPLPRFQIILTAAPQKLHSLSIDITKLTVETSIQNQIKIKVSLLYT